MTAVVRGIAEWNRVATDIRCQEVLGLVPTMGALHNGHGALFAEARQRCSVVVASIFVNPIQFNQRSDFDLYPRVFDDDVAFCETRGVDYIFAPPDDQMYPQPQRVFVDVEDLSADLCGRSRPGHFRGVATVVMKLFQILQPQLAFFGEKDYQQLAIVRRIVRDLNLSVQVVDVTNSEGKRRPCSEFKEPALKSGRAIFGTASIQSFGGSAAVDRFGGTECRLYQKARHSGPARDT